MRHDMQANNTYSRRRDEDLRLLVALDVKMTALQELVREKLVEHHEMIKTIFSKLSDNPCAVHTTEIKQLKKLVYIMVAAMVTLAIKVLFV